jgi:hypothetical protein
MRGAIDESFATRGDIDDLDAGADLGAALLTTLAGAVDRSWTSGFSGMMPLEGAAAGLRSMPLPQTIRTRSAEGYAFYGVYPESYAEAARASRLPAETRVIGIRGIGLSLAAMVAAALGAAPPVTVRPVGHPFARELAVSEALAARLLDGEPPAYAIVDEGPGLSGSSFGAAADWLEDHGVPRERIHFFPGHGGDLGPQASAEHRARWATAPRHLVPFETLMNSANPQHRLETWVAELVGSLDMPLEDISGSAWRGLQSGSNEAPVAPQWERRKFLASADGQRFLVKFAGLGEEGTRKLELSRRLHAAGFGAEPAGICHGFLVERWVDGERLDARARPRDRLIETLGGYLAFRSTLGAPGDAGAPLPVLRDMAMYNTREALGDAAADRLAQRLVIGQDLEHRVQRVEIDGRVHAWEWIVRVDGRPAKTDALDHARAHDFIGAQDIAWDAAGAIAEHDLANGEIAGVLRMIASETGHAVDRELLAFVLPCYLAFQLGAWTMATGPESAITRRYRDRLARLVGGADLTSSPGP